MSEHLPECPVEKRLRDGRTVGSQACICDALRAFEERVRRAAIAECISIGNRHIDRINEEAKAAISEQVANQLFMNADGIEFLVGELRAIQEKR